MSRIVAVVHGTVCYALFLLTFLDINQSSALIGGYHDHLET